MQIKRTDWNIFLRVVLMFGVLLAAAYFLLDKNYVYEIFLAPVILFQVYDFYRLHRKAQRELDQFVESVHYRDFSRHFNVGKAPPELQPLRKGFNEINATFKDISKEKETQFQYLQKILELVDTGILSYQIDSGEVVWMNESLRKLLQIPYLKTIQSLDKRDPQLCAQIVALNPGENVISTLHHDQHTLKIVLSATAFQTGGTKFKLVAFQNVNEALDETESKAWQKLLSVMTHEIMNSIAPISSLAETLKNRLQLSAEKMDNSTGIVDDLELGITTIKKRSEGLLRFAETYRNLNKITQPTLKKIYVRDLFENMHQLMEPTLAQKNIAFEIILKDPDLQVDADVSLIEQVLINLLLNAVEAVKDAAEPKIMLSGAQLANRKPYLKLGDNGSGMPEELIEKIFIPFFSTRKNGSGIGLSLCKQIMLLHKGSIQVQSRVGQGTAFILQF